MVRDDGLPNGRVGMDRRRERGLDVDSDNFIDLDSAIPESALRHHARPLVVPPFAIFVPSNFPITVQVPVRPPPPLSARS